MISAAGPALALNNENMAGADFNVGKVEASGGALGVEQRVLDPSDSLPRCHIAGAQLGQVEADMLH